MGFSALVLFLALAGTGFAGKFPRPDGRIIGGDLVQIENNPWQISLQVLGSHSCGGSIIAEDKVLTAAHCAGILTSLFGEVVAGTSNLVEGISFRSTIKEIIVHENYGAANGFDNDIALIILDTPIPFGDTLAAVQLPDEEPAAGDTVLVTGWGVLNEGDAFTPNELYGVEVTVVDRAECNTAYSEFGDVSVDETMICAGVPEGGKDACQGDSGGPMTKDGVLVGIVSWGYGCAQPGYPGVYTNVAKERDWIKTNAGV